MLHLNHNTSRRQVVVRERGGHDDLTSGQGLRAGLARTFSSLAIHDFRLLWSGMLFTMAAMQITIVSRSWLAYDLSGSGAVLGIVALARGIPQFSLAAFRGVAADRFDKRTLLILSQIALAILALITAVLIQTGVIRIWHLVALGFFQGCIFPFLMPTRTAYISSLVDDDRLPNALALDSSGRNLNRVVAPTLAGFLIAWSPTAAFYAVAVAFALSVLTLLWLPRPGPAEFRSRGPIADALVGFRYIRERPFLIMLIGMALMFVLLGMPYSQLLPVFQVDVFHVGPSGLGFMYTAAGGGAIIGSLLSAYLASSQHKRLIQLAAGIMFGIGLALFALSPHFGMAIPFLVLAGLMVESYFTLNRILLVLHTDKAFYGRVISIYSMSWSLMPVALLPMGAIVDQVGAPITLACAGGILALATAALALFVPGIRRAEAQT